MKTGTITILDARPSKKNPNAKYRVVSIGKNGEKLQQSEALNDVKAVTTHIKAMSLLWNSGEHLNVLDGTKDGKFNGKKLVVKKP